MRRREVLSVLAALGATTLPLLRSRAALPVPREALFGLGVASGFATADSVVLWTRLAPQPLAPQGGMPPLAYPVEWELAEDEAMRRVVARGSARAVPAWGHSLHVVAAGLRPARDYWYRFTAAGQVSPVGRTRTMPAPETLASALSLAVVCCQNYEQGHYGAFRQIARDAPDLVVHLGDYIYEYGVNPTAIRQHNSEEIFTLEQYRARYGLYKSDASLQAAHAASPWLVTWDDHDVENDYAGRTPLTDEDPRVFMARRTAAYQAYFENLPLPPSAAPRGENVNLYAQRSVGSLASIVLLDQRQYRSPKTCMKDFAPDAPPELENCEAMYDPQRTMLGWAQERWLGHTLAAQRAVRWNLIAQGTMISHLDEGDGPARRYSRDNWNTYPAARDRLLRSLEDNRSANPVVLTGDVHAFVVGRLNAVPREPDSRLIAPEFVTSAVSSGPRPPGMMQDWKARNANLAYTLGGQRGYLKLALQPASLVVDLIGVRDAHAPDSPCERLASFTVEAGSPEPQPG